ncbi:MAG: hypothetical protein R3C55_01520 [Parvularculaceae bacterium]
MAAISRPKTVTSASKDIETGTTQIERGALLSGERDAFKATCSLQNVSGTETVAVKDELLGRRDHHALDLHTAIAADRPGLMRKAKRHRLVGLSPFTTL